MAIFADTAASKCWFGKPSTSTGAITLSGSSWTVYVKDSECVYFTMRCTRCDEGCVNLAAFGASKKIRKETLFSIHTDYVVPILAPEGFRGINELGAAVEFEISNIE